MSCLKLFLSYVPLLALSLSYSFSLDNPSGSKPPHFQGFMMTLRYGLYGASVYASHH
jgi:hypothetical protein